MKSDVILVFTCPDRPGIVEKLANIVAEHGGNWEESRLARLCGDFAGIARVSVPTSDIEPLTRRLQAYSGEGLTVHVRPALTAVAAPSLSAARLQCAGADHEGIVNRLAAYLSKQGINVEEMSTAVEPAPTTGTPVFKMSSLLGVPADIDRNELRDSLRGLAAELAVDLTLDDEPI